MQRDRFMFLNHPAPVVRDTYGAVPSLNYIQEGPFYRGSWNGHFQENGDDGL